ncbi:sulfatase [Bacteroidota bacterium]
MIKINNSLMAIGGISAGLLSGCGNNNQITENLELPNIIIIFADDLGYGDLSCYGHPTIRTPNLDEMAATGIRFTQFYVAAPVSTPSRAALLTGCYPKRVGLHQHVLFPHSVTGLNQEENTIADLLKQKDYSTACIGKWHLGHQEKFLPEQHGFDYYYGLPFSNDMSKAYQNLRGNMKYKYELPVIRGKDTLELDPDQTKLTKQLTEEALKFIRKNKNNPFFLYFPHPMPHIPIHSSENFNGKSIRGDYGDVIEEIDWSVGQIISALEELNIDENTIIMFTSDNGPWLPYKTDGGSAGLLRDGKGTTYEGGMREPCIIKWPAKIPKAKVCTNVISSMDLLPTIAEITGIKLGEKNKIDGISITKSLYKPETEHNSDRLLYYYSSQGILEGVRKNEWKLLIKKDKTELYNLNHDPSEKYNLYKKFPNIVEELGIRMTEFDKQLEQEARQVGTL